MTNLERIRQMTAEELAPLLIHNEPEIDYDEGLDGELACTGTIDNYCSPCSTVSYWTYEDCLAETIEWLLEGSADE